MLTVFPTVNDTLFFKNSHFQRDRIQLVLDTINFNGFNLDTLIKKGFFYTQNIYINGLMLNMLREKRYPLQPGLHKKMPLETLSSIPFPFFIDSLLIENGDITYGEYAKKSDKPGTVRFTDVWTQWFPLTNAPSTYHKDILTLQSHVKGKIMGTTNFDVHLFIPYKNDLSNPFWFNAHTEEMNFRKLNDLTQNLMGITIRSGKGSIDIPFISGNEKFSKGKLIFKYRRLKFRLYNREKATETRGIASPFLNFVLNNIMIRSNNPPLFGHTRTGYVYFERDVRKSFVNYFWKSILSGTLSTMGFNNKQQRQEKKEIKKSNRKKLKAKP